MASLVLRLLTTTWLNWNLPVGASCGIVYQLVDGCPLAVVLWLPHHVVVVHRGSHQADKDSLTVGRMLPGAFRA